MERAEALAGADGHVVVHQQKRGALGGDGDDAGADVVAEARVEHAEAGAFGALERRDVLPGLARQRDLAVPAVAKGALHEDGQFDPRIGDAVAHLAEALAEDGDQIARGRHLRVEAEAHEETVEAGLALLPEDFGDGEVLVFGEDGNDVVEVRVHGRRGVVSGQWLVVSG